jgi:hypothetical protein
MSLDVLNNSSQTGVNVGADDAVSLGYLMMLEESEKNRRAEAMSDRHQPQGSQNHASPVKAPAERRLSNDLRRVRSSRAKARSTE